MSNLQGMFTTILNMSITASYVAICVFLVRILLRKAPKKFSYALWAVVLFRLVCPLSFSTAFSFLGLLNVNSQNNAGLLEYVPNDIGFIQTPTVQSGIGSLDSAVNTYLPQATPIASANPMQIWMDVLSLIWIAGIVVLLFYSVLSYIRIKRKLLTATLVKDNVYESDRIGTAFVCGFIHPKIYVPVGVKEADLSYILEHERTHIRRKDYLIKPFAFFVLFLHWFNPLMWLSFALMSRDMEMSCDESVLQKMSYDAKCDYSNSLLTLSVKSNGLFAANPLAFGESHVKARIKNILNYKKPVFGVVIASVIIVISVGIALLSNPASSEPDLSFLNPNSMLSTIGEQEQIEIKSTDYGNTFVSGIELAKWLDIAENDWERKNVSSPYELSPSITINVNDETGNEIRFFESEPTLAMIVYKDKYRYYKIPEEDYASIKEIAGSGYPQVQSITPNNIYPLEFFEIGNTRIEKLQSNKINIIEEKIIDKDLGAFIFTDNENGEFKGGINLNGKYYYIGQVSLENTPDGLMGIEEIQVFGKKAVKIYGILGAHYAQAFYWFVEEKPEESIIQIDGNTMEIDLDDDDKKEIITTLGTIPETRIYMLKEGRIYASDINKSIGAKSVALQDKDKKLFEVYFEPNKPEQYMYYEDSFIRR
jgi:beta-lactamase regulating signal transducer with metallopeptidase domain